MLFTCIKSWFFRNHLANFHQISHWSYCWNVIDSLFKWSCSIDCQAHIFFFKTKNCSNDISLVAMIGLEKCCITSACLQWLCHSGERTVARGPLVFLSFFFFLSKFPCYPYAITFNMPSIISKIICLQWRFLIFYLSFKIKTLHKDNTTCIKQKG